MNVRFYSYSPDDYAIQSLKGVVPGWCHAWLLTREGPGALQDLQELSLLPYHKELIEIANDYFF